MSPDTGPLGGPLTGSSTVAAPDFPARAPQRLKVSFEFFPPKTEAMEQTLWEAVTRLAPLRPSFFSVTYGAGGSTRQRTHDTVVRLKKETGIDPAAHLTCVGATRGEIDEVARAYWDAGIRHVVALRGDPPSGMGGKYSAHPGGYANAAELVAGLKKIGDFQISVAGYPEKHPDSPDDRSDLENLKRKVDACRSRISRACRASPACAAPRCRPGSPICSTAWTTTSRRAA
jgi:methylenetetrahydrofolate reductase (NADPH)